MGHGKAGRERIGEVRNRLGKDVKKEEEVGKEKE